MGNPLPLSRTACLSLSQCIDDVVPNGTLGKLRTFRYVLQKSHQRCQNNLQGVSLEHKEREITVVASSPPLLRKGLTHLHALFEASKTIPARPAENQDDCTLSLTMADLRSAYKRVNPRKYPGPDGVPGISWEPGSWTS